MKHEFQTCRIADIAEKVAMGPFGSNIKVETFVPAGVPIISGAHLKGFYLEENDFNFITEEHAQRLKNSIVYPGDIIFTHAGNVGQAAMIPYNCHYPFYMISQRQFYLRCNKEKVLPEYLTYYFHSYEGQGKLLSNVSQVGVPSIAQPSSFLKTIEVPLPSLDVQRRIVNILDSFTKKIEVNNQINRNLEEQAKTIFKSWFVDFEPFQNGEFVDSELGRIPKGWKVSDIYNSASVIYGAPFSSSMFNSEKRGKLIVRIRDLATELPQIYTEEKHPKGYLIQPGDIVVGMDGEFRAHIWGGEEAWLNQRVCVFKPKESFSPVFVLYSIIPLLAAVEASEVATTVIHLGKNDIDKFRIVIPGNEELFAFNEAISSFYSSIVQNKKQARCLAALRDTLLPKLMSGEINI